MLSSAHVVNMDTRTVSEVGGDFQAGLLDGSKECLRFQFHALRRKSKPHLSQHWRYSPTYYFTAKDNQKAAMVQPETRDSVYRQTSI